MSASPRPTLFLHSSFRTGSTWLWSKFRQNAAMLAYCAVFNEQLGVLSFDNLFRMSSCSWNSHHPGAAPYFLEVIPLLQAGGGVAGFDPAMAIERFFPDTGIGGELSPAECSYIARTVDAATAAGRAAASGWPASCARLPPPGRHVSRRRRIRSPRPAFCPARYAPARYVWTWSRTRATAATPTTVSDIDHSARYVTS